MPRENNGKLDSRFIMRFIKQDLTRAARAAVTEIRLLIPEDRRGIRRGSARRALRGHRKSNTVVVRDPRSGGAANLMTTRTNDGRTEGQPGSTERTLMAAQYENSLTVIMLSSVFFLSEAQANCYKTPALNITTPKKIKASHGSCLLIPCSFREKPGATFDVQKEAFGVWIKTYPDFRKNTNNVIYNSSQPKNSYEMNITGNSRERNCTTVFSNVNYYQAGKYFFRIENWPCRATASCDPVNITVRDSAWSPRINISCDVKKKKKNSATITCSAPTPCPHSPPELTWNLQPDPSRRITKNTDGTFTTEIQQSISSSDIHDGYNIICSVRYPVDGGKHKEAETEMSLYVSSSISPSAGSWVESNCSSRAKPPISCFTWFKKSKHGAKKGAEGEICCCKDSTEDKQFGNHIYIGVKISGIVILFCSVIILQCWSRSVFTNKQEKDPEEADNNRVNEIQAS